MVGPPGFEPGSIGPKPTSISQTNPRALSPTHRNEQHEGYWSQDQLSELALTRIPSISAWPMTCSADGSSYPSFSSSADSASIVKVPSSLVDWRIILRIASGPPRVFCSTAALRLSSVATRASTSCLICVGRLEAATASARLSEDSNSLCVLPFEEPHLGHEGNEAFLEPNEFPQMHLTSIQVSSTPAPEYRGSIVCPQFMSNKIMYICKFPYGLPCA